jgi:hypothetical protein
MAISDEIWKTPTDRVAARAIESQPMDASKGSWGGDCLQL